MEKRYRLRANSDFRRVRTEGQSWSHPMLVLSALPNACDHSRFGFSVSRRIGGAVVRNRVKRLLREVARLKQEEIAGSWDLVFIARSPMSAARLHEVKQAVDNLLRRACLLKTSLHSDSPGSNQGLSK